jgi:hypothetical protein
MIPVWLAGDPLVGILTTVGFFLFLMIGRKAKLRIIRKSKS